MCPNVTTDHPTWLCLEDKYMLTHDFEHRLFETMKDEPSDVYHSLIIIYLIKDYHIANALWEFHDINDFFVNYCFDTNFFVKFMALTILLLIVMLDYLIMKLVVYNH